ncbi:unnamed protein product [Parajaminaea phylloscopi]
MASKSPALLARRLIDSSRLRPRPFSASPPLLRSPFSTGLISQRQLQRPWPTIAALRPLPPVHSPSRAVIVSPLSRPGQQLCRSASSSSPSSSTSGSRSQEEDDAGSGSRSAKPSFRERFRHLWKRYGWWAIGVYNLWSLLDFSLTWAAIHWFGADHIRQLETRLRSFVGLEKRKTPDEEVAAWPLNNAAEVGVAIVGDGSQEKLHENNEEAAKEAAKRLAEGVDERTAAAGSSGSDSNNSTLWAEAVLAYTIHKTLLLPLRIMATGAITPSFVNWMVRLGWAKPLPPLKQAATKVVAASGVASTGAKRAAEGGAAVAGASARKL